MSRLRLTFARLFGRAFGLLPGRFRLPVVRALFARLPRRAQFAVVGFAAPHLGPDDDLPIAGGPLAGAAWIVGSTSASCVLGTFSAEEQQAFVRHVRPGGVVFDVGANAGFFTLLASRLAGEHGSVVAFEPFSGAVGYLRRHVELNDARNVTVIEAAVSDRPGTSHFAAGADMSTGRLTEAGDVAVSVVSLDDLCGRGEIPKPNLLKIDVEGEELNVLRGAATILAETKPTIVLETHGYDIHTACSTLLSSLGYELEIVRSAGANDAGHRAGIVAT